MKLAQVFPILTGVIVFSMMAIGFDAMVLSTAVDTEVTTAELVQKLYTMTLIKGGLAVVMALGVAAWVASMDSRWATKPSLSADSVQRNGDSVDIDTLAAQAPLGDAA